MGKARETLGVRRYPASQLPWSLDRSTAACPQGMPLGLLCAGLRPRSLGNGH